MSRATGMWGRDPPSAPCSRIPTEEESGLSPAQWEFESPREYLHALIAEWNRRQTKDLRHPKRDIPGSSPGGGIIWGSAAAGRRCRLKNGVLRVRSSPPSFFYISAHGGMEYTAVSGAVPAIRDASSSLAVSTTIIRKEQEDVRVQKVATEEFGREFRRRKKKGKIRKGPYYLCPSDIWRKKKEGGQGNAVY